ncbi:MAG TPA: hypothetical protein ENI07_15795 [Desulfobacterales bacterium]|nr:hypothetical protein [Desulfobacterales bacterium]
MKSDRFCMRLKEDELFWLKSFAKERGQSMAAMFREGLSMLFKMEAAEEIGLEPDSKKKGVIPEDFIREAVEFYNAFPVDFLKDVKIFADDMALPVQNVIANILMKSSAYSFAWLTVFGNQPPGFLSEFRYDEKGKLITGPELLKQLTTEAVSHLQDLKKKLEGGIEAKTAVVIDKQSMAVFQECLL